MDYYLYAALIGFLVGGLVGLTGMGGGVLLLPLLILGLRVPPIVAVGSSAVFMFFTKIGGAMVHWRLGNVDWRLGTYLAVGSIPGALGGVSFLAYLRAHLGDGVNEILRTIIGVLLVVVPLLIIAQALAQRNGGRSLRERLPRWVDRYNGAVLTGLVGGFLVGMTSVGSGSVVMLLLLLFFSRKPMVLVGTDIFHAAILTGVTGLLHFTMGNVDLLLVSFLLVGSIPGILLGSNLTAVLPAVWLRRGLVVVLIGAGLKMI